MYDFEKSRIVAKVAGRIKAKGGKIPKGMVNLFAREEVRSVLRVTNPSDVKRLARDICSTLGQHGAEAKATKKALAKAPLRRTGDA